jgi:deoxyribonuclease V
MVRLHVAVDVHYREGLAVGGAVAFSDWSAARVEQTATSTVPAAPDYVPGAFYRRELEPILACLKCINGEIGTILVDGYVALGADQRPGLGWHVWHAMGRSIPVIGVAKSRFEGTSPDTEVLRGASARPLFVTAIGLELGMAKSWIKAMHGPYRMPTLLTAADALSRLPTEGPPTGGPVPEPAASI